MTLKIDTERLNLNTVAASIKIPAALEVSKIYNGDSAVVIWINEPKYDSVSNTISFSGITPGGFSGIQKLISFVIKPSRAGSYTLGIAGAQTFKNDGKGTEIKTTSKSFTLIVSKKQSDSVVNIVDTTPPENFSPSISTSPDLFNGNYFLSFATQDKGVGIDHYDVATSWLLAPSKEDFQTTNSPMVLDKLSLFKIVYVKAIDKLGNEKNEYVWGPYRSKLFSVIGIIIILGFFFLASRKRKR